MTYCTFVTLWGQCKQLVSGQRNFWIVLQSAFLESALAAELFPVFTSSLGTVKEMGIASTYQDNAHSCFMFGWKAGSLAK